MADQVHDPPEPVRYPWDLWTDGNGWKIRRGVDYQCDSESMQTYLYRAAQRRQMTVHTTRTGDEIVFRFTKGQ